MSKIYRFKKTFNHFYDLEAETENEARKKLEECEDLTEYQEPDTIEDHQQEFEFVDTVG